MLKRKSRILAEGLAWSRRWLSHGLMSPERQRRYEQKYGPFPTVISAEVIRRIRHRSDADETVFARAFNCASRHVRDWEQGRGHPRGPELKLIHLARKRGLSAVA